MDPEEYKRRLHENKVRDYLRGVLERELCAVPESDLEGCAPEDREAARSVLSGILSAERLHRVESSVQEALDSLKLKPLGGDLQADIEVVGDEVRIRLRSKLPASPPDMVEMSCVVDE